MKAVIMAGGEGTRLRPLTCTKPKPMVYLANVPVMTHAIELLKKHGIKEIGVTLQYMAPQIMDYYGDGREYGVKLHYFLEDMPLGTAGSVKNAEAFLDETFLVISGDALTDINLSEAIEFHRRKKSVATLILSSVANPLEYGIVISKKSGEIIRFLEKPSWGEVFSDQVNTGMYILEPEILNYIPPKTNFDFSKNLFPLLMEGGHVLYGYPAKGYWCDIGNPQSYLQANADILLNNIVLNLPYDQYAPGIWVGKNTEIDPTARLEAPLIIGHNCYVGPRVSLSEYCVIGDNCRIGEGASLKRTVLWNGAAVGKGAQLRGAVLCSNAQVKAHSAVYEGAIIGDESIVKERCIIKPGSKIWPNKTIEEGTVFKNNLVWGVKSSSNLFSYRGVRGEFNLDISLELALRLGFAFGSLLDPGVKIGVSSDDLTAAKIVKQVLSSGLQLVGQQVYDLGEVTAPITRFAIRHNNLQAGVNISFAEQEELLQISFFNEKGANINKAQEKKIENILAIDDFRFINPRKIKEILPLPGMYSLYFSNLRQQLKTKLSAKLIYSCPASKLSSYFQQLLEELGCQVEKTDFSKLKDVVQQKNADLGIYLDGQGETFILYDEKGNVIKEDKLKVLLAYLLFKEDKNATIVAPVDAPSVLEKLAEKYKGRVIRTKSAPEVMMEDMLKQGSKQFALEFDGVQAVLNILRFLEREQLKLSQLNSAIPSFYLHKDVLECPWEIKGRIIRSLVEDTEENNCTGSLEGVKFTHPEGWALIMPDSEKPLVKIFCESSSYELAEEISNFYKGKIQLIMKTQS